MESSAFTTATSETSIRSVTQPSGSIVARNWIPSRTPNSQVRTFLFSGAWTSTGKPGELITYSQPTTLNGPIPLPHVLITGSSTSGYSIDNPSGTNPTMSGMTHFGLQYCSNGLYRTGYKVLFQLMVHSFILVPFSLLQFPSHIFFTSNLVINTQIIRFRTHVVMFTTSHSKASFLQDGFCLGQILSLSWIYHMWVRIPIPLQQIAMWII